MYENYRVFISKETITIFLTLCLSLVVFLFVTVDSCMYRKYPVAVHDNVREMYINRL